MNEADMGGETKQAPEQPGVWVSKSVLKEQTTRPSNKKKGKEKTTEEVHRIWNVPI